MDKKIYRACSICKSVEIDGDIVPEKLIRLNKDEYGEFLTFAYNGKYKMISGSFDFSHGYLSLDCLMSHIAGSGLDEAKMFNIFDKETEISHFCSPYKSRFNKNDSSD